MGGGCTQSQEFVGALFSRSCFRVTLRIDCGSSVRLVSSQHPLAAHLRIFVERGQDRERRRMTAEDGKKKIPKAVAIALFLFTLVCFLEEVGCRRSGGGRSRGPTGVHGGGVRPGIRTGGGGGGGDGGGFLSMKTGARDGHPSTLHSACVHV